MGDDEWLAHPLRGAPVAPAGGRLPDARLAHGGGRRGPGRLAAGQPARRGDVDNLGGWLTTIVARVCLNMLRSRARRREEPLGAHLPDPVVALTGALQPETEALLADSVGLALLIVLDTLHPPSDSRSCSTTVPAAIRGDRADGGPHQAATRQLASRGRRRIRAAEIPTPDPDLTRQRAVVDAFFRAARGGDFDALVAVLHPDVVLRSDFGDLAPGCVDR